MNMQDNELDNLFRSKLGNLEVQPSAHIWSNIASELGDVKKRSFGPVLRIAATVLVVMGVGAWFMLDKPAQVKQQQTAIKKSNPSTTRQEAEARPTIQPTIKAEPAVQLVAQPVMSHKIRTVHRTVAPAEPAVAPVVATPSHTPTGAEQVSNTPVLAATSTPVNKPALPDMSLTANDENTVKTAARLAAAPVNDSPMPAEADTHTEKKKKRIHSLGGLINAVIAKVDKREDKLIEFTENDEQENVTGINLGIIKIKRAK
jgi:hypothetical protein